MKTHWGLFFLIIFLAILLRLIGLDKGINSDEGWLLKASQLPFKDLYAYLTQGTSLYPPLGILLLHFWIKISSQEWWVRLHFVLFGIGICLVLYHLSDQLFKNKKISLAILFLSSISPLLIWTSQFIRSYIDFAFWALLSIYFLFLLLKNFQIKWAGIVYILISLCAFYTSYLMVLIIISQNLYIFSRFFRHPFILKKWVIIQVALFILILPALFLMLQQRSSATTLNADLHKIGLIIFNLNIGLYIRSLFATVGFDPNFFSLSSLIHSWPLLGLLFLVCMGACIFIFLIWKGIRSFHRNLRIAEHSFYFPFILFSSLLIYNFLFFEILHHAVQPEYFVVQHTLFLLIIASMITDFKRKIFSGGNILLVLSIVFLLRYPSAISPEFETKKASQYLTKHYKKPDLIFMVRKTNFYIDPNNFNIFNLSLYFKYKIKHNTKNNLPPDTLNALADLKRNYTSVWFYKIAGNDEISGTNQLIIEWFRQNDYIPLQTKQFKRVSLTYYVKGASSPNKKR